MIGLVSRLLIFSVFLSLTQPTLAFPAFTQHRESRVDVAHQVRDVYVHGYTRKNGTYVRPHMRSAPNGTKADNWSTKGNVNPYTGKPGTKNLPAVTPSPIRPVPPLPNHKPAFSSAP